ncbi:MAG: hypothetical protein RLZZ440_2350, partial [Planctomycetota bacterium]
MVVAAGGKVGMVVVVLDIRTMHMLVGML